MRFAVPLALLLAAAARQGCGGAEPAPYDPCAGKACGEQCHACPPDDPNCFETADLKACDPTGRCASAATFTCAPSDSCAGKACGASCVWDPPCRNATPPCMMPSAFGHCGADGACVPGGFAGCTPEPACEGKTCGATCDPCGGMCMHPYASACDYAGRCMPVSPWICYDPCAGKACGEQCHPCPPDAVGCVEPALFMVCDPAGTCTGATPVSCP